MGKGRMFTNLHSLEKLGKAPSAPGFPEKQDSLSLRIASLGGAAVYRCDLSAQEIRRL